MSRVITAYWKDDLCMPSQIGSLVAPLAIAAALAAAPGLADEPPNADVEQKPASPRDVKAEAPIQFFGALTAGPSTMGISSANVVGGTAMVSVCGMM